MIFLDVWLSIPSTVMDARLQYSAKKIRVLSLLGSELLEGQGLVLLTDPMSQPFSSV